MKSARHEGGVGCRCGARWTGTNRAHCATCHETFSSVAAFDFHRRGGLCSPPAEVGMARGKHGYWVSKPMPADWVAKQVTHQLKNQRD